MKWLAIVVSIVVVAAVVAAFVTVGSPTHQRLLNFDQRKVSDLGTVEGQIVYYWQVKKVLPQSLDDLKTLNGYVIPTDPQNGAAYGYKIDSGLNYELCADFNLPTDKTSQYNPPIPYPIVPGSIPETWNHGAGPTCFTRTIDPTGYTPLKS